jgi:colanic acid/amylovoran biosynthesis glycosyltransferase
MMRIAFLLHRFPAVSETFVVRQIIGLMDSGHDVHIYSERYPTDGFESAQTEMKTYNLAARTTYLEAEMPPASGHWSMPAWPVTGETWLPGASQSIQNSDRILRAVPVLRRCFVAVPELTIAAIDPDQYGEQALSLESLYHLHSLLRRPSEYDMIHAHFGPVANSFRFARALWKAPLVVTFHGYDFSMTPRALGPGVYRRLFQDVDAVMTISEYAQARLEELGCPPEKLHVIRMGLCLDDFPFRARDRTDGEPVRILTVGRLVEKKGLEYALRAVARVRRQCPALRYNIIGDGPLKPKLQQLVDELELGSIVTLCGAKDGDFVRRKMAESHLFLLPSATAADGDQEGIPVSLMEAQASGMPVLSTRHSGIGELVSHGESGFLVPERDVDALADRLSHLIKHSEEWARMGREGRKLVDSRFNMATLTVDLIELYENVRVSFRARYRDKAISVS